MKKTLLVIAVLLGINTINTAQVSVTEDNDIKNFRFGLKGDLSFNWLNPEDKKELLNNGTGVGYAWGLQLEFRLNKTVSVVTGLNLLSQAYKLDYNSASAAGTTRYVLDLNEEFVDLSDNTNGSVDSTQRLFELNYRSLRGNFINIPLTLKMKTNEIGYMTYFGEFGVNINILTKGKVVTDEVNAVSFTTVDTVLTINRVQATNEDLDASKSMGIFNMGIKIGGGAEYNISGSTSLFFGVHYNHYFLNALRGNDKFIQKEDVLQPGTFKSAGQKAIPGAVSVTVGILF